MFHVAHGLDTQRLDLIPEQPGGQYEPFTVRWSATDGTPVWELERDQSDNLAFENPQTNARTAWLSPDDVFHVQDLAIEGGSSIDAGTLDGLNSSAFVRADTGGTITGDLDVTGTITQAGTPVLTTADEGALDAGTLEGATLAETRPSVSDDATVVHASPTDVNAGQYLQVTNDGDGTITLDALGGNAVGSAVTASGDGTQTTFTLPHELGTTPASVDVTPTSADAMADFYVSAVRAADLDITYTSAPSSGTDNLSWHVTAFGNDGSGKHAVGIEHDGAAVTLADTIDFAAGFDVTQSTAGEGEVTITHDWTVSDDGTQTMVGPTTLDFGPNLGVSVTGDDTVTITGSDTYPSVSSGGTLVASAPGDINAGANLTASSDGDGTVTLQASGDADTLDGVNSAQFLRSDADDDHTATLGVSTLDAAGTNATIGLAADLAPATGVGFVHTEGSATHRFRLRRDGLQALADGADLPTDYGTVVESDATVAFVETDDDRVAGFVNTNNGTLTMRGGARFGDSVGGPANVTLDVRGEARFQLENRTSAPSSAQPGRMWLRTDSFQ